MDRPRLEVADVLRRYGEAYREQHAASLSTAQRRVMSAIELCRTAALGSHREHCDQCPYERTCYDSCRNRHCPKCQSLARAQWIEDRQSELLDTQYFHVVFTLPEEIAAIAYQNKKVVYDILFRATSETLRTIAADPKHLGAEIGFFAVLHSWGQNLMFHPHLHCVVPGGGLSLDGDRWVSCRPGFFLPVRVLSRLFRRLFLELLQQAFDDGQLHFFTGLQQLQLPSAFAAYLAPLRQAEWVVYAKAPFAGPQQVLDYVGRYTHRVAISNHRLLDIDNGQVQFRYKDYRQDGQQKTMTLSADEFIRRFLLHVLPDGFHRIRYYGFLGNRYRQEKLERCRQLLGMAVPATEPPKDYRDQYEELTGISPPAMPGLPPRSDDSNRSATNPGLFIPNVTGHFMRTHGSQPLAPQACPKQVRAQVSSHTLPGRSLCFLLALHVTDLRSLGINTLPELFFGTTPTLFSKPSSDSIPIVPAPSRRFSPIHF